jgi:hypothetical protein
MSPPESCEAAHFASTMRIKGAFWMSYRWLWRDLIGSAMPYCLMENHYHLLIETPNGSLSKGMRAEGAFEGEKR